MHKKLFLSSLRCVDMSNNERVSTAARPGGHQFLAPDGTENSKKSGLDNRGPVVLTRTYSTFMLAWPTFWLCVVLVQSLLVGSFDL